MLTIEDVCELYSAGTDLKMRRNISKEDPEMKGLWDWNLWEVNIYLPLIDSKEDFYITLIHEFVHAKKEYYSGNPGKEEEVEALAQEIYRKNPNLPLEIIELYGLKVPKYLR